MTALLDLPAFRERVHGLSVEDYHRLGELGILSTDASKILLREKDVLVCKSIIGIQFTVAEILPASV